MIEFEEKPTYAPEDLDYILKHLEIEGFNDVYFSAGRPIIYKHSNKNKCLGTRNLQRFEVESFINYITKDSQAASAMQAGQLELHPSHEISDDESDLYRYRVSAVTARDGFGYSSPFVTMRSISGEPVPLEKQRVEDVLLEPLRTIRKGLIVIAGATGSGKSTLMSGLIEHRVTNPDSHEVVLTYESPIEYVYEQIIKYPNIVSQHEIAPIGGHLKTFADGLRASLREGPTTILIGESRDRETFEGMMKASNTGHLCLTTMHVNRVPDIPNRVVNEFPPEVRKARLLELIGASKIWLVQALINKVGGGRVPIRSFLVITPEVAEILSETDPDKIRPVVKELVSKFGQTMEECASRYYEAGEIYKSDYELILQGGL